MDTNINSTLPVAIIGAGPVGLAAASHLLTKGEQVLIFEAGDQAGANILKWSNVRMFSPWEYNIDKASRQLLESNGWVEPNKNELPTGGELVKQYLRPLSEVPEIKKVLHVNTKVVGIARKGLDKVKDKNRENLPFEIYVEQNGKQRIFKAKAVIDATGTWSNPNPVLSSGIWTSSESSLKDKVFYGIPDIFTGRSRYAGKKVMVVGSGHSSINAILELGKLKQEEPGTEIIWVIRKEKIQDVYGGQEKDGLPARGELGIRVQKLVDSGNVQVYNTFHIQELIEDNQKITVSGISRDNEETIYGIDEIITATGARPDLSFLREIRINLDPAIESVAELAPLIDPNIHSCGTVRPHGEKELRQPEKDFYVVGMKSYGRAPTFLLATGYEQVRSIVAYLTGDFEGAKDVQLELPETGVCSISFASKQTDSCSTVSCETVEERVAVSCCTDSKEPEELSPYCCG